MTAPIRRLAAVAAPLAAAAVASPLAAHAADPPTLGPNTAGPEGAAFVPGELLVRFKAAVDADRRAAVRRAEDLRLADTLPLPGVQRVELAGGDSVRAAARALERRPEVLYAQPNFIRESTALPNDPGFGDLWGLHNTGQRVGSSGNRISGTDDADIDGPEAWEVSTGTGAVQVAIVDGGIAYDHPDLAGNIWSNPGETGLDEDGLDKATNLVDDDGNGYVDDHRGWDFTVPCLLEPCLGGNDPRDEDGHGTHVSGTAGADGDNGTGVVGVSWDVELMALRALDGGSGTDADIATAFRYAAANGAEVVNASLSGPGGSPVLEEAVGDSGGTLFVVAAGNDGRNVDSGEVEYPCGIDAKNLVCVAASDQHDRLASFSNYGRTSVDLAAPGENILSTYGDLLITDGYAWGNGTSMATPHVAGAAALGFAFAPGASPAGMRRALIEGADQKADFDGTTVSGGRLNAAMTLELLNPEPPDTTITSGPGERTANRYPSFAFTSSRAATTFQCRVDGGAFSGCSSPRTIGPLADGQHTFEVRARSAAGVFDESPAVYSFLVDATGPAMSISGSAVTLAGRRVPVELTCPLSELSGPCTGKLRLRTARKVKLDGRKQRVRLGAASFRIRRGATKTVEVKLSRSGRRLMEQRRRVKVDARAHARDALGNERTTRKTFSLKAG